MNKTGGNHLLKKEEGERAEQSSWEPGSGLLRLFLGHGMPLCVRPALGMNMGFGPADLCPHPGTLCPCVLCHFSQAGSSLNLKSRLLESHDLMRGHVSSRGWLGLSPHGCPFFSLAFGAPSPNALGIFTQSPTLCLLRDVKMREHSCCPQATSSPHREAAMQTDNTDFLQAVWMDTPE